MTTTPHGQVPEALTHERDRAIMEGERNASLDAYSRAVLLTSAESRLYEAAFTNGWDRCAAHVQNPAEIEHVAGDVSKNGAELNMMELIDAYAEARHVGGCHTYNAKTAEARAKVIAALRTQQAAPAGGAVAVPKNLPPLPWACVSHGRGILEIRDAAGGVVVPWIGFDSARHQFKESVAAAHAMVDCVNAMLAPKTQTTPSPQAADNVLEDAMRYRWLRDTSNADDPSHMIALHIRDEQDDASLSGIDAAIDAAIAASGGNK